MIGLCQIKITASARSIITSSINYIFPFLDDGKTKRHLSFDDTLLMPKNSNIIFEYMSSDSAVLSTTMNPKNKSRITPF